MRNEGGKLIRTVILISIVTGGWGVSFMSLAVLLDVMEPMQMLAARWSMTLLAFLVLIATGKLRPRFRGKKVLPLFLTGFFEPCAYAIFEAYGIRLTSASTSAIFIATIPAMTLAIGILFFHHRADKGLVISLVITFSGVLIASVFSPVFSVGGTRAGMVCMLLAVAAASLYGLFSKKASEDFDPQTVTFMMALEGAVLFSILAFARGHGIDTYLIPFGNGKLLFHFLFLSLFCALGSYTANNRLLSYVDTAVASNITGALTTLIGVAAGILFRKDIWGWYTVVGMVITLTGVWLSGLRMRRDL